MTIYNGTLDNTGPLLIGHAALLTIKNACEAEGWTTMSYDTTGGDFHEWIGKANGLSGTESIYVGIRARARLVGDIYTLGFYIMTTYVAGLPLLSQPGVATHTSQSVSFNAFTNEYYIFINQQRLIFMSIKNADVVNSAYVGKFFPFAKPDQYTLPMLTMGQTSDSPTSNTNGVFEGRFYDPVFTITTNNVVPNNGNSVIFKTRIIREIDGIYGVHPVYIIRFNTTYLQAEVYGQIDGVYQCSGDNLQNLSVIQVSGSSVVDQTGLTKMQAITAINAVGGDAYLAVFTGTLRGPGDAYCIKAE